MAGDALYSFAVLGDVAFYPIPLFVIFVIVGESVTIFDDVSFLVVLKVALLVQDFLSVICLAGKPDEPTFVVVAET